MSTLIELVKLSGGPGSLRLLLVLLATGFVLMKALPRRRAGTIWLGAVTVAYTVMALPAIAQLTVDALPASEQASDAELEGIQTLFFFDGDNRWGRLREFARIDRVAMPRVVYLLGRQSVHRDLRLMGVPSQRIRIDETSANTSDQIRRTANAVEKGGLGRAAILVSSLQAPRARLLARQAGLAVPVLAAPLDDELAREGTGRFAPSFKALAITRDAIYEVAALRYYRDRD